jgi:uncharacterized phage-like protein YoqJ
MQNFTQNANIETVCFTGHRFIRKNSALMIPTRLKALLEELIGRGARRFRAGGAIGFDTVAALCVLELKEKHPDIKLELILPCRNQSDDWNEYERQAYKYILSQADSTEYVTDTYTSWCMHERNRRLVNGSQVCIAYLTESRGGTAYTFNYALTKGLEVINIAGK